MVRKSLIQDNSIVVRCYARKSDDQWVAVCVDLCLAAQGDSCDEAKTRLHSQVEDYVMDLLESGEVLTRPAPASQWLTYWYIGLSVKVLRKIKDASALAAAAFRDSVSMEGMRAA